MAKELPYFKFEPGQWDNGNIQMCSRESKGLFIDLCSIYWSRLGELPYALALQKLCNGNKDALQELLKHEIIQVNDDEIVIVFLDEQLKELNIISEKRRNAANKRWNDASALQVQSKSNAIRREEKRIEEKKEESYLSKVKIQPFDKSEYYNSPSEAFEDIKADEKLIEDLVRIVQRSGYQSCTNVTVALAVKNFLTIESAKPDFDGRTKKDLKTHLINWINKNAKTLHNGVHG